MNDYTLTIQEVSQRLNKSVRTIHRYKDSGKLSFQIGATKGNPVLFCRSEVERLARELLPSVEAQDDAAFLEKLERVERTLRLVEQNPMLERLVHLSSETPDRSTWALFANVLQELDGTDGHLDRKTLGMLLIQLGNALVSS